MGQAGKALTEEEWVVLLDVYQGHRAERLSPEHPAILAASATLKTLGEKSGRGFGTGFRPPSGVFRQITLFRRLDRKTGGSTELLPALAKAVWEQFSNAPEACRKAANDVRRKAGTL